MNLGLFDYSLPQELVALQPLKNRDHSRMLVVNNGRLIDSRFEQIFEFLTPGDLLVLNDSKVIPAKLTVQKNNTPINIYLHKQIAPYKWQVFAKPGRKLKIDDEIQIIGNAYFKVIDKNLDGQITIQFNGVNDLFKFLEESGETPLPPYIEKHHKPDKEDKEQYQTVFAKEPGSVAAPTAGLHFSEHIFKKLQDKAINYCFVTLHVGGGTFLPIKTDNINDHKMHSELCTLTKETAELINRTKSAGHKVIAVGSTAMRTIEASCHNGRVKEFCGETDIFIKPGFKFQICDMMLTNFHLPKSTLLVLVAAFTGYKNIMTAYKHAIEEKYRFFSYGDCCLLYKETK